MLFDKSSEGNAVLLQSKVVRAVLFDTSNDVKLFPLQSKFVSAVFCDTSKLFNRLYLTLKEVMDLKC